MAIKLHQLNEERAEVVIPVGDDTLEVSFRPGAFTPAAISKLEQAEAGGAGTGELVKLLSDAIVEWGLLDEKGDQIPVTVDALSSLPIRIVRQISEAISGEMGPNAQSAGG